jgi:hypothetical protein
MRFVLTVFVVFAIMSGFRIINSKKSLSSDKGLKKDQTLLLFEIVFEHLQDIFDQKGLFLVETFIKNQFNTKPSNCQYFCPDGSKYLYFFLIIRIKT